MDSFNWCDFILWSCTQETVVWSVWLEGNSGILQHKLCFFKSSSKSYFLGVCHKRIYQHVCFWVLTCGGSMRIVVELLFRLKLQDQYPSYVLENGVHVWRVIYCILFITVNSHQPKNKKTPRRSHVAWVLRQNGSCLHLGHNKVSHTRWDIHSYLTPQLYATSTRNRMNSHPFCPNITYQMAFANCNTSKDTNNWNNKRQSEYKFSAYSLTWKISVPHKNRS